MRNGWRRSEQRETEVASDQSTSTPLVGGGGVFGGSTNSVRETNISGFGLICIRGCDRHRQNGIFRAAAIFHKSVTFRAKCNKT